MLPDYATYDEAIGLDWYEVDPNLRFTLDRLLPDAGERAFAEELVADYGPLVGGPIARRAEITDKNGPVLQRWTTGGVSPTKSSTTRRGSTTRPTWCATTTRRCTCAPATARYRA